MVKSVKGAALLLGLSAFGCGPAQGEVTVTLWGEDYIADHIPPAMGTEAGFENGWTVRFQKFLVSVGNVTVGVSDGTAPHMLAGLRVFDLVPAAQPVAIGTLSMLEARRMDRVSYEIAPAADGSIAGNVSDADLQWMQSQGYAVYLEGEATQATQGRYTFRWGFRTATRYAGCHDASNMPGIVVPTQGTGRAQLTVHGDHLFYDDLQSPEAKLRFDAIAQADTDGDREVTLEELAAVDLTRLPANQYGAGSARDVVTLRDFVTRLVATLGHFDGEGHCDEHAL
jgi:hypothetical protein